MSKNKSFQVNQVDWRSAHILLLLKYIFQQFNVQSYPFSNKKILLLFYYVTKKTEKKRFISKHDGYILLKNTLAYWGFIAAMLRLLTAFIFKNFANFSKFTFFCFHFLTPCDLFRWLVVFKIKAFWNELSWASLFCQLTRKYLSMRQSFDIGKK